MNKINKISVVLVFLVTLFIATPLDNTRAQNLEIRDIHFPVDGIVTFTNDFGDPRSGGRSHEGIDLIGKKMMPLVSAVDGVVSHLNIPEASWGYAIYIRDADGYEYHYLHVNNDTPGTDDGNGGLEHAYAPGIVEGARVTRGQLIGWMGDSGNAETVGAHLHFEIERPYGSTMNPYESLRAALSENRYDPEDAKNSSPAINEDKQLVAIPGVSPLCDSGSLIKSPAYSAVYYCGADSKRYVFPNQRVFNTWYADFSNVIIITQDQLSAIPLGGNVTFRPGTRLVKVQSDPKVYAIARGGELRWVTSSATAISLYGSNWEQRLETVPDYLFVSYRVGDPITS